MEAILETLKMPFVWGLALGLLFFVLSAWSGWKTRREFARYKRMLSDKMELEAETLAKVQASKKELEKEAENLRIKVAQFHDRPDGKVERELEILARAEKSMMISAPGFAGAWETAKAKAAEELAEEDSGKSLPKRIFRKFFGGGSSSEVPVESLPEGSAEEHADEASAEKQVG